MCCRDLGQCFGCSQQYLKLFNFCCSPSSYRFQFFVDKVLPQYRDSVMSHTLIYIPSYFDYVRLRNYMKKEEMNFASICEYSSKSEVSRARYFFQKGDKQFLLFTERFHFYKRSVLFMALFDLWGILSFHPVSRVHIQSASTLLMKVGVGCCC